MTNVDLSLMRGLDLFSGIGGITKALDGYVRPVAYCEIEPYARGVLLSRMHSGDIPLAPIWDDVLTLRGAMLPQIDIIYGGFPCQDISSTGHGAGLGGKRSGLFFEIMRLAEEIKPAFIFLENSPFIRSRGLNIVTEELASLGYDCRWGMLSAEDVGAIHKRKRWFLLAHSTSETCRTFDKQTDTNGSEDGTNKGCFDFHIQSFSEFSRETLEPYILGEINGIPYRMDRDRALGNAVVPAQAREAFERLMGLK